ncbi:hypothetical protein LY622_19555 [Halomonas sp. M5N1S17]|uniref:hypothetical protein n=1 Tax=Halomonas alkalisoli TaxID=2907158 RepID=UPI001F312ED4|nr:hypothetical protein [Halomonas alkalisoli]MCE9665622.1 hypothetical protein [Halomonas alkalisoli]
MIRQEQREWVQGHLEEIFTAVLTAFFTALMFRVGLGMLFSIVTGLALAYGVRLIAMRRAVSAVRRRVPWLREPTTPA